LGARTEATADRSAARGHRDSARLAYLRAANYRYAGFWYVLGTKDPSRWEQAWLDHRRCLDAAFSSWPEVERFAVPWRAGTLPAYLIRGGARLLVVQNGLGAPLSVTLMTGVLDAVARGWSAVAFDGPGQGATRVVDGVGPVDDWGGVITAVIDAVQAMARPMNELRRIALLGVADGAALAVQAAARDRRVVALACDPGVLRPVEGALGQLPVDLAAAWRQRRDDAAGFERAVTAAAAADPGLAFTLAKLTEQWPGETLHAVLTHLETWDVTALLGAVTVPVLVCDPDQAMSYPGQSAELAAALGDRATLVPFTTAEGAGLDCEIGAPTLRAQRIHDWLDEVVPPDEGNP
jgi:pimeloyl-ACP methyl ester carboxylesterase